MSRKYAVDSSTRDEADEVADRLDSKIAHDGSPASTDSLSVSNPLYRSARNFASRTNKESESKDIPQEDSLLVPYSALQAIHGL